MTTSAATSKRSVVVTPEKPKEQYELEGVQYHNYQDYCDAKRARNQRQLESLGLVKGFSQLKSPVIKKRVTPTKHHPTVRRSSARVRRVAPIYTGETIDLFHTHAFERPVAVKKNRAVRQHGIVSPSLSPDQRAALDDSQDWLDELDHFLRHLPHGSKHQPCSPDNARNVMSQVKKLVAGCGITYTHWPAGIVFEKKVSLKDDFDALYAEAQAFQNTYGHDRGNGWLLLHPIKKLKLFQEYKFTKGKGKTA